MKIRFWSLLITSIQCACATTGYCAEITGANPSTGPGLGWVSVGTPDPPVPDQSDELFTFAVWSIDLRFDAVGYIDVPVVADEGFGTAEYLLDVDVENQSSSSWVGIQVSLGRGSGAAFVKSAVDDGLDFDTPDLDSLLLGCFGPFDFLPSTHVADLIVWSGGNSFESGVGSIAILSFSVDVPEIDGFTMRFMPIVQSTTVPSPSSFLIMVIGTLMALNRRPQRVDSC